MDSVRRRRWTSTVSLSSGPEPLEPDVSSRFKPREPGDLCLAETGDAGMIAGASLHGLANKYLQFIVLFSSSAAIVPTVRFDACLLYTSEAADE